LSRKLVFALVTVTVSTLLLVALAEILLRWLQPTSDRYLALTPGTPPQPKVDTFVVKLPCFEGRAR
jgi:hypothetical protein